MSQDNKKSIVMYQGDGSNRFFPVPMTKGKYGTISVAFVRRGLDQYEYNPTTWGVNGDLFAWDLSGTRVYTDTATPAVGATIYDQYGVGTGDTVSAISGDTITVNTDVYTRDATHDVDENSVLTWTGDTLQIGDYIVIERTTTRTQPFEFQNNQKHIEKSDDNLERQIQEVADKVDNALLVDPTHTIDSNKMNPVEWMQTILRSVDKSVRGFRYLNGWLDYSLDDPNIADVDKTWTHLLNTDNIKAVREQSRIEDGETIYWTEYLAQDGSWKILSRGDMIKLSDLADVDFTNLSAGNFIMFDGLKWKNVYSSATASWGTLIGDITTQADLMAKFDEYVHKSGDTMTGVLKMRASESFKCAIAPSWDGVGFFKLNDDDSVTLMASMEETDGLTPATHNKYNIGKSAYRWKDLYLSGKAYMSVINNGFDIAVPATTGTMALLGDVAFKSTDVEFSSLTAGQFLRYDGSKWVNSSDAYANTGLSNLTATGKNISNWSSNVSNCITEIPQDINLELSSGTLTLKAGSKVYVPNGAGVFDVYTVASDISSNSFAGSVTRFVFVDINNNTINAASAVFSGTTAPTLSGTGFWYDTTNNVIKRTTDSGATWTTGYSFPIAIVTSVSDVATSIDQVFNGFGYIGSTVFALPGVKVLEPNGRNTDGTLKNTSVIIQNVITKTIPTNLGWHYFVINPAGTGGDLATEFYIGDERPSNPTTYSRYYNPTENKMYTVVSGAYTAGTMAVIPIRIEHSSSSPYPITSWDSPTAFHAVDYNDAAIKNADNVFTGKNTFADLYVGESRFANNGHLELVPSSGATNGGYIDFHYAGSSADYTSRIIEDGNGRLNLIASNGTLASASDAAGSVVTTVAKSKSADGYFKLGNGLIIQWGTVTGSALTYPTPFSSATSYAITVTMVRSSSTNDGHNYLYDHTATGCRVEASGGDVSRWIAIGY